MEEKDQPSYEHYNSYLISFYFLICSEDEALCSLACLRSLLKNFYWGNSKHFCSNESKSQSLLTSQKICLGHRIRAGDTHQVIIAGSHKSCLFRVNCLEGILFWKYECLAKHLKKKKNQIIISFLKYILEKEELYFLFQSLSAEEPVANNMPKFMS